MNLFEYSSWTVFVPLSSVSVKLVKTSILEKAFMAVERFLRPKKIMDVFFLLLFIGFLGGRYVVLCLTECIRPRAKYVEYISHLVTCSFCVLNVL